VPGEAVGVGVGVGVGVAATVLHVTTPESQAGMK
jgi:hypothetical protein